MVQVSAKVAAARAVRGVACVRAYFDKDQLLREGLPKGGHSSTRTRGVP